MSILDLTLMTLVAQPNEHTRVYTNKQGYHLVISADYKNHGQPYLYRLTRPSGSHLLTRCEVDVAKELHNV